MKSSKLIIHLIVIWFTAAIMVTSAGAADVSSPSTRTLDDHSFEPDAVMNPLKSADTDSPRDTLQSFFKDMDIVLIDTAGRSQTDQLKIRELQTFLEAAKPDEVHLVLSSTAHHSHMLSAAEEFSKLGVDRLILTKLDEAISFGVVLSVLRNLDASLSYITTGQDVPDDIEVGSGRQLAQKLLGLEPINSTKNAIQQKIYA